MQNVLVELATEGNLEVHLRRGDSRRQFLRVSKLIGIESLENNRSIIERFKSAECNNRIIVKLRHIKSTATGLNSNYFEIR